MKRTAYVKRLINHLLIGRVEFAKATLTVLLHQKRGGFDELLHERFDCPLAERHLVANRVLEIQELRVHLLRNPFLHDVSIGVAQMHVDRLLAYGQIAGQADYLEPENVVLLENRPLHHDEQREKLLFEHQRRFAKHAAPAEYIVVPVGLYSKPVVSTGQIGRNDQRNILRYVNGALAMHGGHQIVAIVNVDQQFGFRQVRLEDGRTELIYMTGSQVLGGEYDIGTV